MFSKNVVFVQPISEKNDHNVNISIFQRSDPMQNIHDTNCIAMFLLLNL